MWYQTAAGYAVLALQLTSTYALRDLFYQQNQTLNRVSVSPRPTSAPDYRTTRDVVESLEQALKKQLSLLKVLAAFNSCFQGSTRGFGH